MQARCRRPRSARGAIRQVAESVARRRGVFAGLAACAQPCVGIGAAVLPWRAIAPIARPDPSVVFRRDDRARPQLAALGDCAVCHTDAGGLANAGGRALETPFGTIYTTNITPDAETGIGAWSYPAFERAMREGIHRDGRHLYPAFPYKHFTKTSDADLQALYAYLMSQPPVRAETAADALAFPFNVRPLMAGWNALFHRAGRVPARRDADRSWNRGAYLVEGLGHCGACHTPRNALGAERQRAYLAGGMAEGWDAPALTSLSHAPMPWSEDELFAYLRSGESPLPRRRRRADGAGREGTRQRCRRRTSARWRSISRRSTRARSIGRRSKRSPRSSRPPPAPGRCRGICRRPPLPRRLRGLP